MIRVKIIEEKFSGTRFHHSNLAGAGHHVHIVIAHEVEEAVQAEIAAAEKSIAPRFSPGYGDFPLDCQKDIFAALDCGSIGLTLNDNLFMTPSKSVTAVIGVREG